MNMSICMGHCLFTYTNQETYLLIHVCVFVCNMINWNNKLLYWVHRFIISKTPLLFAFGSDTELLLDTFWTCVPLRIGKKVLNKKKQNKTLVGNIHFPTLLEKYFEGYLKDHSTTFESFTQLLQMTLFKACYSVHSFQWAWIIRHNELTWNVIFYCCLSCVIVVFVNADWVYKRYTALPYKCNTNFLLL